MKKPSSIQIATYNVQFSLHPEKIVRNVSQMAKMGVSVFCLQEVVFKTEYDFVIYTILKKLGPNWMAIYNLEKNKSVLGMGNCIIWNNQILQLQKEEKIFLPRADRLRIHEKIFSWIAGGVTVPFHRRSIAGYFEYDGYRIRITNIHLDHNGGLANRKNQLRYLVKVLSSSEKMSKEVICGDFNSFDLMQNGEEMRMHQEVLGGKFNDVSINTGWTADLNDIDIAKAKFATRIIKTLNLHIKRKIDFIWVKNITCLSCQKLLVDGSDHKPLIATLSILPEK